MPRKTKKKAELETRRRDVARLYNRRFTQEQIAEALGVNQSTVSRDIAVLLERWQGQQQDEIDTVIARELVELDLMEKELWTQWQATKDSKVMRLVLDVKKRRADLLGLDAPQRQEVTGKDGGDLTVKFVYPDANSDS